MKKTAKAKFNKHAATLWLLTICLSIGICVSMQFINKTSLQTLILGYNTPLPVKAASRLTQSPTISVSRQPVFRSVGRTRGS